MDKEKYTVRQRPQYHLMAPSGFSGDPNGTIYYEGRYHFFWQYSPAEIGPGNPNQFLYERLPWGPKVNKDIPKGIWGMYWSKEQWAHAVSDDLVNWEHWPVALKPTPGGYDGGGCFSGCTVVNDGVPTIVYSSNTTIPAAGIRTYRTQSIATSKDGMRTWEKHPANPVLADVPDHSGALTGWDVSHVWQEGDTWYMAVGSGFENTAGVILLYQSPNLVDWEYMHPLAVGSDVETSGDRWVVPDFFPLRDRYVLLVQLAMADKSKPSFSAYFVGDYIDNCFILEYQGFLETNPGPNLAARTLVDGNGRRIMWGNLGGGNRKAGWGGVFSLPRLLDLSSDGRLLMEPVPEVCAEGDPDWQYGELELSPGVALRPDGLRGDSLEIRAEIDPGNAEEVGLKLRCSPGGEEETVLVYTPEERRIALDWSRSSPDPEARGVRRDVVLEADPRAALRLHVFLDHSVIEVFANGRACLSCPIYPSRDDSVGLECFANSGGATIRELKVWRKEPANFPIRHNK